MRLSRSLIASFLLTFYALSACQPSGMCEKEIHAFLNDETNGLLQKKDIDNNILIRCIYRPAELLFKHDTSFSASAEKFYWFSFNIEYTGSNSIDFLGVSKELSQRIVESEQWFSFMSDDKDYPISRVQPVSYLGAADKMSYLLAINKDNFKGSEGAIQFQPTGSLRFLSGDFVFDPQKIKKVPPIEKQC